MRTFRVTIIAAALLSASCAIPEQHVTTSVIDWDDGDSGTVNGVDFRLSDVDAPETGGVGAAIGGAKCEEERELGKKAKLFMQELTSNAELIVTHEYATDAYGRRVIDLSANGKDVAQAGLEAEVLRSWDHEGTRALEKRPQWCDGATR